MECKFTKDVSGTKTYCSKEMATFMVLSPTNLNAPSTLILAVRKSNLHPEADQNNLMSMSV